MCTLYPISQVYNSLWTCLLSLIHSTSHRYISKHCTHKNIHTYAVSPDTVYGVTWMAVGICFVESFNL